MTVDYRIFNYLIEPSKMVCRMRGDISSNNWRIFYRDINVQPHYVNAYIVLHNFVLGRDGYSDVDTMSITDMKNLHKKELSMED